MAADIIVFIVSLAMSVCVGFNQFFDPNGRWKALRTATQSLHSIIWKFRSRVEIFEYDSNNPNAASSVFHSAIDKARIVANTDHICSQSSCMVID
jgi:hypothetical protein